MKTATPNNLPRHDYGQAIKNAVSWLGDRYLLAEPVRRRSDESAKFYVEPRRWIEVVRRQAAR
jgi:hypothetical protein